MPPAHSTPLAIITAYVAAENVHDHATAAALVDPAMGKAALDHVIGVRLVQSPTASANPGGTVSVGVLMDVRGGDSTFGHGRVGWTFALRRGGPSGWRVYAEGQG